MKKKLLTVVLLLFGTLVFAQEKIAVFPFEQLDKVFTGNDSLLFYRQFSNEFTNKNSGRFTIIPRQDVERLINTEMAFQLSVFSAQEKTAEMNRVLNGSQILSGLIAKRGSKIRISVSLYTYPELSQLPGGVDLDVGNVDELFDKIPELVQRMQAAIGGGGGSGGRRPPPPPTGNFVRVEGGTFTMGSPSNEAGRSSDETQHRVTVSSFYMSKYEVTQAEYEEVMGNNPSNFKGYNLPVENVTWYDAVNYCNRLSQREGLTPAYAINGTNVTWNRNVNGYRLPTEAEWEYACRAGTTTPFNTGYNITTDQANYDGNYPYNNNSRGRYRQTTTAVGSFAPNEWGLYDMHGNVWEWCWDWYGDYSVANQTDPAGAVSGANRVLRGGSWDYSAVNVRSATRGNGAPSYRSYILGFRLVRP